MIPRILHYCWFGGKPLPRRAERFIAGWQRHCPGYGLRRWDESNAPLTDCLYVRQAVQAGKWAFVSDYVRLWALLQYGGIYLDTDVELVRPLDPFLDGRAFLGFESPEKVATCVIGAEPGHPLVRRLLRAYESRVFLRPDGSYDETTNVVYTTMALTACGLRLNGTRQELEGVTVYPADCFSPLELETGRLAVTSDTAAIHHFQASWMSPRQRLHRRAAQWLGPERTRCLKRLLNRDYKS